MKIKVVHLVRNMRLRAGIERVIFNLTNFIDLDRYEVYIYSFTNDPVPDDWLYINKNVKILQQSTFPFEIKNNLIHIRLSSYRTFIKAMKQIDPNVVHTHFDYYFTLLPYLLSKTINAVFLETVHTMSIHSTSGKLFDKIMVRIESYSIRRAKMTIVPVSDDMFKYLLNSNLKLGREYFYTITNGIDENYFCRDHVVPADLTEFGIENKHRILINLGRLEPQKNQAVIIGAMGEVVKTHPDTRMLFLGNKGSSFSFLESLVKELNLEQHILFLGEQTDVASFLAASHIGVFPSLWEGLSNALLEMMSMELPMILSDIPTSHQVTAGMDYPFFIQLNDYLKLAEFIRILLNDREYSNRLGKQCRQQVIEKFTAQDQALKYMALYESLIIEAGYSNIRKTDSGIYIP